MTNNIVLTEAAEIKKLVREALFEYGVPKADRGAVKLFTVNQVAKKLGRSHRTITKMVRSGLIKTTASGQITENALNDYLKEN